MTNDETEMKNDMPAASSFVIRHSSFLALICIALLATFLSCDRPAADTKTVVLYTSIDEPIARPIIEAFEKTHGVKVTLVTDTEANKSVGLAEKLRAEKDRPRADVWWGNEPFHTINLAEEGLFAAYESPSAADVPAMFRDPKHRWAGNGLRARVFLTRNGDSSIPYNMEEMAKFKIAMARPSVGTAAGYIASLYLVWGEQRADAVLREYRKSGVILMGGNGPVADAVARRDIDIGLTDNDDASAAVRAAGKNDIIWGVRARLSPDDDSTFMIPTTVALVANRPVNIHAKKLTDYLLSKDVEQKLIQAQFAGWSTRDDKNYWPSGGAVPPNRPKAMQIDYTEVAKKMPEAVRRATAILEGREP